MKIIRKERNSRNRNIGPNHHFLEVFRKYQNSPNITNRSLSAIRQYNIYLAGFCQSKSVSSGPESVPRQPLGVNFRLIQNHILQRQDIDSGRCESFYGIFGSPRDWIASKI